jgi:hypothetical protein
LRVSPSWQSAAPHYGNTTADLAAAVANAGTVTSYPTGTVQADYTSTNAGVTSDNMAIIDGVKYTGGTLLGFSLRRLQHHRHQQHRRDLAAGADCYFGFPKADPVQRYNGAKAVV